jgi:hypothetical protein
MFNLYSKIEQILDYPFLIFNYFLSGQSISAMVRAMLGFSATIKTL